MLNKSIAIVLLLMLVACRGATDEVPPNAQTNNFQHALQCFGPNDGYGIELCPVSFYDLLANQSAYHGHNVAIEGLIDVQFDQCYIFPNAFSAENLIWRDSIHITDPKCVEKVALARSNISPVLVFIAGPYEGSEFRANRPTAGKIPRLERFSVGSLARGPQ